MEIFCDFEKIMKNYSGNFKLTLGKFAGPLGLKGGEPARQTNEPGSNPSWDATVHLVCETFNVMHVA